MHKMDELNDSQSGCCCGAVGSFVACLHLCESDEPSRILRCRTPRILSHISCRILIQGCKPLRSR